MKYKIYKLVHNGVVQYVGRTTRTLEKRMWAGYGKNTKLFRSFNMELIEETNDAGRESFWISYYRDINIDLYNIRDGNMSQRKEYLKKYRSENEEYFKKYRLKNKESYIQYQSEYRLKNKKG